LRGQWEWHRRKAKRYLYGYVIFQIAVIAISFVNWRVRWSHGPQFEWVAIFTATSLMIQAMRDFLDLGPLMQRYLRLAEHLENIDGKYHQELQAAGDKPDPARLRRLTQETEEVLAFEFQNWYARR
jgi:hypothetical protein